MTFENFAKAAVEKLQTLGLQCKTSLWNGVGNSVIIKDFDGLQVGAVTQFGPRDKILRLVTKTSGGVLGEGAVATIRKLAQEYSFSILI